MANNLTYNNTIQSCKFRGISFPVESVEMDVEHDMALHKKPDVPGAIVEMTGRNPIRFRGTALFINGIRRGAGDDFPSDDLFPGQFNKLLQALANEVTAGEFVHPTLGIFNCKPVSFKTTTDANLRNGQRVEFELIEANKEGSNALTVAVGTISGLAFEIDNSLITAQIKAQLAKDKLSKFSFADLVGEIVSFIDSATLFVERVQGKIKNVIYLCNRVINSLDRLASVTTAIIKQNIERMKSLMYQLSNDVKRKSPQIKVHRTTVDVAPASLANTLSISIETLLKYNPNVAKKPVVRAGTLITYPV